MEGTCEELGGYLQKGRLESLSSISSPIFENVIAKWTFCVQQFFSAKVAIIKTRSATIDFFLFSSFPSPRSFFFSFPFPSIL